MRVRTGRPNYSLMFLLLVHHYADIPFQPRNIYARIKVTAMYHYGRYQVKISYVRASTHDLVPLLRSTSYRILDSTPTFFLL